MINELKEFKGKTFIRIDVLEDEIIFHEKEGKTYKMFHEQDCCEYVRIEDICGDITDLLNTEILISEEVTEDGENEYYDSFTWTFYKFSTIKGHVTIRWYGESNGYYSESVEIIELK